MKQIILTLIAAVFVSSLALAAPVQAPAKTAPAPAKTAPAPAAPVKAYVLADIPALVKQLDNDDYYLRETAMKSLLGLSRSIVRPMFATMQHGDAWIGNWTTFIKHSDTLMGNKMGNPMRNALKRLNSPEANYRVGKVINTFGVERQVVLGEWLTKDDAPAEVKLAKNDKRPVHVVTTAKEFAKALGNDRIIHIKAKTLDLCNTGIPETPHFSNHPSLKDLKNTRIECLGETPVDIPVADIARSLDLSNCNNVQLINMRIVRKIPVGVGMPSQAGAIYLSGCEGVTLDRCTFRDSWAGFHMTDCKAILVSRCRIENNLYQLGHLEECTDIRFFATSITNNGMNNPYTNYCGIRIRTVKELSIDRCLISGNNMRTVLYFQDSASRAAVRNSLIAQQMLSNRSGNVKVTNSRMIPVKAKSSPNSSFLRSPQVIRNGAVIQLQGGIRR